MDLPNGELFSWITYGVLTILSLSLIIAALRLVKGPSLSDRVIALDLIAYITIGFIATYAISSERIALLDAATVLALVAFLGTTAFARYVQQSTKKPDQE
jgi:multicomponent Na+:H+ antiporter subunit F